MQADGIKPYARLLVSRVEAVLVPPLDEGSVLVHCIIAPASSNFASTGNQMSDITHKATDGRQRGSNRPQSRTMNVIRMRGTHQASHSQKDGASIGGLPSTLGAVDVVS